MTGMSLCMDCDRPVKPGLFLREINGFEEPRAQGGANKIELRRETGAVICRDCMDTRKLRGQTALL